MTESKSAEDRTHFGYREVDLSAKTGLVRDVFDSVAGRYDLMNDLMSGGVHRLWRASLIDSLRPRADMHLLDVAGGTGDMAARFLNAGGGRVTVCDLSERMTATGRDRTTNKGLVSTIDWVVGNAEALPFASSTVDAYTIAFGLRNVARIEPALAEACRVLKPGGRFLCLELSHVSLPWLQTLYDRYSFSVMPAIGAAVTGDRDAYRYLVESIRRFPPQEVLARKVAEAGFSMVSYRNLSGGIAALHAAWRI